MDVGGGEKLPFMERHLPRAHANTAVPTGSGAAESPAGAGGPSHAGAHRRGVHARRPRPPLREVARRALRVRRADPGRRGPSPFTFTEPPPPGQAVTSAECPAACPVRPPEDLAWLSRGARQQEGGEERAAASKESQRRF